MSYAMNDGDVLVLLTGFLALLLIVEWLWTRNDARTDARRRNPRREDRGEDPWWTQEVRR